MKIEAECIIWRIGDIAHSHMSNNSINNSNYHRETIKSVGLL
jgi:hypothetical protein